MPRWCAGPPLSCLILASTWTSLWRTLHSAQAKTRPAARCSPPMPGDEQTDAGAETDAQFMRRALELARRAERSR